MLAWFGTITSILGSFLVAFGVLGFGYVCFTLGSISWLIVAYTRKDYSLGVLNGTFFLANVIGLFRYTFGG